jgi:hypothetical protein
VAEKWRWIERARAWDADERSRLRKAHYAHLKAMNTRHQEAAKAVFARSLKAIVAASTDGLSFPAAVASFERAVNIERRVMGEPVGVELTIKGGRPGDTDFQDAIEEASADVSPDRFSAGPEVYLGVARIMAQYEVKSPPVGPDGDAEANADPAPLQPPARLAAEGIAGQALADEADVAGSPTTSGDDP